MTTYTVYGTANGSHYDSGLSAIDAADIVLSHDGHEYEIGGTDLNWSEIQDDDDLADRRESWCLDQASEMEVGCKTARIDYGGPSKGFALLWPESGHIMVSTNANSEVGIWTDRYLFQADGGGKGRPLDGIWQLYVSRGSRNSSGGTRGLTEAYSGGRLIFSTKDGEKAARQDIAEQVIAADWDGVPDVMTDTAYQEMLAEAARDAE